jgi:hypothetical protein
MAPFGIVAASEVHPQPQILLFGNAPTVILHWWVPPLTVAQPQVYKKQLVTASCDEKTHEQWSHAPLFMGFLQ